MVGGNVYPAILILCSIRRRVSTAGFLTYDIFRCIEKRLDKVPENVVYSFGVRMWWNWQTR